MSKATKSPCPVCGKVTAVYKKSGRSFHGFRATNGGGATNQIVTQKACDGTGGQEGETVEQAAQRWADRRQAAGL